jgi:hypothetical protein
MICEEHVVGITEFAESRPLKHLATVAERLNCKKKIT